MDWLSLNADLRRERPQQQWSASCDGVSRGGDPDHVSKPRGHTQGLGSSSCSTGERGVQELPSASLDVTRVRSLSVTLEEHAQLKAERSPGENAPPHTQSLATGRTNVQRWRPASLHCRDPEYKREPPPFPTLFFLLSHIHICQRPFNTPLKTPNPKHTTMSSKANRSMDIPKEQKACIFHKKVCYSTQPTLHPSTLSFYPPSSTLHNLSSRAQTSAISTFSAIHLRHS